MSLSETPVVHIQGETAGKISDEILGGSFTLCKEVGYKPNILMFTFFWTAFLFSVKKELIDHDLIDSVRKHYVFSLGYFFPDLFNDKETQLEVENLCQHYYNNFSNDFLELNTETEITNLLLIANKLNSEDDLSSPYLIKTDPRKSFIRICSNIQSNTYNILRRIDCEMSIQYRGIIESMRIKNNDQVRQDNSLPFQSKTVATSVNNVDDKKLSSSAKRWIIALIIVFIVFIIASFSDDDNTNKNSNNNYYSNSSTVTLNPVSEPMSGTVLTGAEELYGSEITIAASSGKSCVVKLKTASGITRLSFYVRAGDIVTMGVPAEYLYVYFASGDTWYGEYHLFGENTSYSMDDEIFNFEEYTCEYTLYPVSSGNFSQTPIDKNEF